MTCLWNVEETHQIAVVAAFVVSVAVVDADFFENVVANDDD